MAKNQKPIQGFAMDHAINLDLVKVQQTIQRGNQPTPATQVPPQPTPPST